MFIGNLMRGVIMSTLLAFSVSAHEVQPAVGDVTINALEARVELRLALEGIVAGVDLNGLEDTNESPLSGFYDRLRAQEPAQFRASFDRAWPRIASDIRIEIEGTRITPELVDLRIPEVGDVQLPRESVLILRAALPEGTAPVSIGWNPGYGALVLRQQGAGDDLYTGYLSAGTMSDPLPREGIAQKSAFREFGEFIVIGFEHILPKGLDHILFVLGIFFFSAKLRPLLWQVTAFTLAHTVTLALATLKIVTVSPEIVEPLIAASIVFIAFENLRGGQIGPLRLGLVFGFGLLHGLGFASVLGDVGLNPSRFVADLIGFNIGVEIGQLTVIAIAYIAVASWARHKPWYRPVVAMPISVAIGLVGAWWVVERTLL